MKVIVAPGPVSYPLIMATRVIRDLELVFGKEGKDAYAVADSLVSLARRGLRPSVVTVRRLLVIYPELRGPNVGVWRRGSAADVLIRAYADRLGFGGLNFVYADDWYSLNDMFRSGQVQSVVLNKALVDGGLSLEDALDLPGACGIYVNGDLQYIIDAYEAGIELVREDPEGSAEYIASKLPIRIPREFIVNVLRRVEYGIFKPSIDSVDRLISIVNRYGVTGYE
ncbi:MAG: DUF3834 domain-containing protein [Vulcanisaeta sp. AZ3]|jgi:hypothetical protein